MKRVFLVVLDSVGIGELPDAGSYGDIGSNTLRSAAESVFFSMPNLGKAGLFHIEGVDSEIFRKFHSAELPEGAFGRLAEQSAGKDTTTGHWEIAGVVSKKPLPVYPNGFPDEVLKPFIEQTGKGVLCNQPYSGTEVIQVYGKEHLKTGALIVYTSADSVFQIAAHEDVVSQDELYRYCAIARKILRGKHGVGRVIARPFTGKAPDFKRTSGRHDFSIEPPEPTLLTQLKKEGYDVLAVGKIKDIFAGAGVTDFVYTKNNLEGIHCLESYMKQKFEGLCFVNLVDFDMLYGHRNDADGYAKALREFDERLPDILALLQEEDILMITADHGCDPGTPSTDHSREYVPLVICGTGINAGTNLGTRGSFGDIAATILDYFQIIPQISGKSFLDKIVINRIE